jgi:exocyst complex protein 7
VSLNEQIKKEIYDKRYVIYNCRYSTVPFTKNPEKYIKYAPAQVSALIDRFFDVAA